MSIQAKLPCNVHDALSFASDGEAVKLARLACFLALREHAQLQAQEMQRLVRSRAVNLLITFARDDDANCCSMIRALVSTQGFIVRALILWPSAFNSMTQLTWPENHVTN
jgi:hypothetical protein